MISISRKSATVNQKKLFEVEFWNFVFSISAPFFHKILSEVYLHPLRIKSYEKN